MPAKFVSMNLSVAARDAVQRMAVLVSAEVTRRIPLSPVVLASLQVAERHMAEVVEQLAENERQEQANPEEEK